MKMILIVSCNTCPHGTKWSIDGEYICIKTRSVNKDGATIPVDCPLKDAPQHTTTARPAIKCEEEGCNKSAKIHLCNEHFEAQTCL